METFNVPVFIYKATPTLYIIPFGSDKDMIMTRGQGY